MLKQDPSLCSLSFVRNSPAWLTLTLAIGLTFPRYKIHKPFRTWEFQCGNGKQPIFCQLLRFQLVYPHLPDGKFWLWFVELQLQWEVKQQCLLILDHVLFTGCYCGFVFYETIKGNLKFITGSWYFLWMEGDFIRIGLFRDMEFWKGHEKFSLALVE